MIRSDPYDEEELEEEESRIYGEISRLRDRFETRQIEQLKQTASVSSKESDWAYEMARWVLLKVIDEAEELGRHRDLLGVDAGDGEPQEFTLFPAQSARFRWSEWFARFASSSFEDAQSISGEVFSYMATLHREAPTLTSFYRGRSQLAEFGEDWKNIIELLNSISFARFPAIDRGYLFERLMMLEYFAAPNFRSGEGVLPEHTTERSLCRFMVKLLRPQPGESIHDPACGSGGFLVAALRYILSPPQEEEDSSSTRSDPTTADAGEVSISGCDLDEAAQLTDLARLNLTLHGAVEADIRRADLLAAETDSQPPRQHDIILCNAATTPLDPHTGGKFLSAIIDRLAPGGRCAVIVPNRYLEAESTALTKLRMRLVDDYTLKAVISLQTHKKAGYDAHSIIVFSRPRRDEALEEHPVVFVQYQDCIHYPEPLSAELEDKSERWFMENLQWWEVEDEIVDELHELWRTFPMGENEATAADRHNLEMICPESGSETASHNNDSWHASPSRIRSYGYTLDSSAYAPYRFATKTLLGYNFSEILNAEISQRASYLEILKALSSWVDDCALPQKPIPLRKVALADIVYEPQDAASFVTPEKSSEAPNRFLWPPPRDRGRGVVIIDEDSRYLSRPPKGQRLFTAAPNSILFNPKETFDVTAASAERRSRWPRFYIEAMVNQIPVQCDSQIFHFECDPDTYDAQYIAWAMVYSSLFTPLVPPESALINTKKFTRTVKGISSAQIVYSLQIPLPDSLYEQRMAASLLQSINTLRYTSLSLYRNLPGPSWPEATAVNRMGMRKGHYIDEIFRGLLAAVFTGRIPTEILAEHTPRFVDKINSLGRHPS